MAEMMKERFEFTYESGALGSFLVISADTNEKILSYQVEMLANNPNKNILPLDVRQNNDKFNLYYTVTSKLALSQYLKRNKLKRGEFIGIFLDIVKTILDSKDYLLSDKSFLLDEDYIFINPNTMEVSLVYLPISFDLDINKTLRDFTMNFIMYSANIDDTNSDNFLQRILNFIKSDTFNVLDFDKLLKDLKYDSGSDIKIAQTRQADVPKAEPEAKPISVEPLRQEQPKAVVKEPPRVQPEGRRPQPVTPKPLQQGTAPKPGFQRPSVPNSNLARQAVQGQGEKSTGKMQYKSSSIIIGAAVQSAIVIGAIALIVSGALGKDIAATGFALFLIGGAASYFLWKNILDKKNMVEGVVVKKEPIRAANPPVNMEKREIRNAVNIPNPVPQKAANSTPVQAQQIPVEPLPQNTAGSFKSLEETTMLSSENLNDTMILGYSSTKYPYLQGKKDGVMEEIKINKPSFIIGRLRDQVDYVSSNNAIGKVHAEIITKDGCYYIKDLNSRNGTYVNDVRIDSNKEYGIKNGDKITLANSEFTFIVP
ncbi:MAG: DUF6382 domain-containing protein [Bacillota bacterium]